MCYHTIVKPQHIAISNASHVKDTCDLKSFIVYALRESVYVYDSMVNSILNWTVKIRKLMHKIFMT